MGTDLKSIAVPYHRDLHRFAILQFTQSLGTLLSGGTPMVPAIEIASQSVANQEVATKVFDIVQQGELLHAASSDHFDSVHVFEHDPRYDQCRTATPSTAATEMYPEDQAIVEAIVVRWSQRLPDSLD